MRAMRSNFTIIPAKAGIQGNNAQSPWIAACAELTGRKGSAS